MKDNECEKSQTGEHEINFEDLVYSRHAGLSAAVFKITCLHCGAIGELTVESEGADWF